MLRGITAFRQDHERHWIADLECGHSQHVRHEPPLTTRPWVLTDAGRTSHLGTTLDCLLCDREDAQIRGLCDDGADEVTKRP